jgi:hypothetical protein
MHTPVEFYVKLPRDLFRGGTPTKPRFDYLRTMPPRSEDQVYDVKIDPETNIIDCKSGGLSLFDEPNFNFGPDWWVIPKGTCLPPGFTISKDLTGGKLKGHYTIRSLSNIHVDTWKKILKEWAEENAVHLSQHSEAKSK